MHSRLRICFSAMFVCIYSSDKSSACGLARPQFVAFHKVQPHHDNTNRARETNTTTQIGQCYSIVTTHNNTNQARESEQVRARESESERERVDILGYNYTTALLLLLLLLPLLFLLLQRLLHVLKRNRVNLKPATHRQCKPVQFNSIYHKSHFMN